MDSFFNLSPLNITVSRKVISFSDISAVILMVGWNLLPCSINMMEQWSLIQNQPLLKTIYLKPPIISYKRGKSLKDKYLLDQKSN